MIVGENVAGVIHHHARADAFALLLGLGAAAEETVKELVHAAAAAAVVVALVLIGRNYLAAAAVASLDGLGLVRCGDIYHCRFHHLSDLGEGVG